MADIIIPKSGSEPKPLAQTESAPATAEQEEVRTLFVSGLPLDVKYREIYNLFYHHPGFDHASLNSTVKPVAFVAFKDQPSALACKDALTGHRFDPESSMTLRIELAKHNSNRKRSRADSESDSLRHYPPSVPSYPRMPPPYMAMPRSAPSPSAAGPNKGPCSTLFVANMNASAQEAELHTIFDPMPGCNRIKFVNNGHAPVAFIDFGTVQHATDAMNTLNGATLPSGSQIRIEFAKNRMGTPSREKRAGMFGDFHPFDASAFNAYAAGVYNPSYPGHSSWPL